MFLRGSAILLFCLIASPSISQPISAANFQYWYDAQKEGNFKMHVVNHGDSIHVFYRVDTSRFEVRWEKRESYSQRSGDALSGAVMDETAQVIHLPVPQKAWILLALVTSRADNETAMYFRLIEANYPVDCVITGPHGVAFTPYAFIDTDYTVTGPAATLTVYRYADPFPAAGPPFSETSQGVDPILEPDSSFTVSNNSTIRFTTEGMYLIQADTTAARGTAIRAVSPPYPRLSQLEDLASALVFISTREEYEKLLQAGKDKVKFDKVILDITRDKDRAKNVIRKYFRRVEMANIYFESFKEGWKTDRGMTYIIFGPPDEVARSTNSEVWTYKKSKSKFVFNRSPSIYDPDNFVLQRDKRLMETWYYTIDMWRKNQIASAEEN
jgi:GWxTD domain-containing protein